MKIKGIKNMHICMAFLFIMQISDNGIIPHREMKKMMCFSSMRSGFLKASEEMKRISEILTEEHL